MTKVPPDRDVGKSIKGKPGANDGYRWIELRNLREVLAHEGPPPHILED
jgi:hypothetical protein